MENQNKERTTKKNTKRRDENWYHSSRDVCKRMNGSKRFVSHFIKLYFLCAAGTHQLPHFSLHSFSRIDCVCMCVCVCCVLYIGCVIVSVSLTVASQCSCGMQSMSQTNETTDFLFILMIFMIFLFLFYLNWTDSDKWFI